MNIRYILRIVVVCIVVLGDSFPFHGNIMDRGECLVKKLCEGKVCEIAGQMFSKVGNGRLLEENISSAACISCHDGTISTAVMFNDGITNKMKNDLSYFQLDFSYKNHPVNVLYPEDNDDFISVNMLNPQLLLLDRRVVCITCHNNPESKFAVTVTLERSRLCLSCHWK